MEEFSKISFASSETSTKEKKRVSKKYIKILGIFIVILALLGLISIFAVILPGQKVYSSAQDTYKQARSAWDALKMQNVALAGDEIAKTKINLQKTQKDLQGLSFLRFIPLISSYYSDAEHLTNAASYGLDATTVVIESVEPYADVLGLKGKGSFVMGSAEQRVQTAILTMGKITPQIDEVADLLLKAQKEVDAVDPNRYPSFIGGDKVKKQLAQLREITDQSVTFVDEARPLIKVLPSLLGESKEKRYLILFQNDKELRSTGGFITAYAVFRIDKGIIHVDKSDDIYTLDNSIRNKPKAPDPILKYLPKVPLFNLRDSNISPDYVESMKLFESLYSKSNEKAKIDGIIALDTHVLVSIIKILDDEVSAGGIKFTSQIDKRCDCPQVIYVLEDNISRPVGYVKTGRKDLLGVLLYAIMEKSLKSSPKIYWGPLFQDFITMANEKHVLFYLYDKEAQKGIESLNVAGRIQPFEGDYLHINESNMGGAKSNLFVNESVKQEYQVASDGVITKTVTLNYKNPYPPSDCDLERGGLCLNAVLRNWFRIYVPKGSVLVDSKGSEIKMTTYEELGKTVFEGFLTVRPQGSAMMTITYKLPFKLEKGSPLPVLIQKQPGTDGFEYTTVVNGKTIEKFPLTTDKKIKIKL